MNKVYHQNYKKFWEGQQNSKPPVSENNWFQRSAEEASLLIEGYAETIVDVGCGDCIITCLLAEKFKKIYGLDFSNSMLESAKINIVNKGISNIHLIHADLLQIDEVITEKVDAIICSAVIQHISIDDLNLFIKKCKNILNEDGKIIIIGIPNLKCRDLYLINFYKNNSYMSLQSILYKYLKLKLHIFYLKLSKKKYFFYDGIGNWYLTSVFKEIGDKNNLVTEFYNSNFISYSYRFNVIFKHN